LIIDIDTTKTKVARLLAKAKPKTKTNPYPVLWMILGISLIGTMLPVQAVVTFFSLTAVTTFLVTLVLVWKKQLRFSKKATGLLLALFLTSIVTGCSPAIFSQTNPEMIRLIHDRDYKYFSTQHYGIFGLGLDDLTIENAQFEGNIETVYVAKIEQGYGIISVSRITVAGE